MPIFPTIKSGRIIPAAFLLLAVNLTFTACGGSAETSSVEEKASEATNSSIVGADDEEPETGEAQEGSEAEPAEEPAEVVEPVEEEVEEAEEPQDEPSDGVPGEPLDFGPQADTALTVVGVDFDDVLNFRADPDPSSEILAIAVPTAEIEILALGEAWTAPGGVWWKVSVDGQEAWANQKFLGGAGAPADIFADVAAELATLEFETLEDAGRAVAVTRASTDPESRIVLATEPLALDAIGGFVIIDVLDLGDDSVKGERLRVDVEFVIDEEGEEGAPSLVGVILTGVDATPICSRGVSDGFCV